MFLPPGGLFVHQKERSLNHLRIQRISLPFWPSSKSNLTQFVDIDRLNEQWPFFFISKFKLTCIQQFIAIKYLWKRQEPVCSFWKQQAPGVFGISASLQSGIKQS